MSQTAQSGGQGSDPGSIIAGLRERGAQRVDPVRFRFIEALARRSATQSDDVRRLLEAKLAELLLDFGRRIDQASAEARRELGPLVERFPHAADEFSRLARSGDSSGLRRLGAQLEGRTRPGLLAGLVDHLDRLACDPPQGRSDPAVIAPGDAPAELKALRYFRATWSKLIVERQVSQSLAKLPANAGPLNSQRLVLRALEQLREVSPAYLERWMSYVDALLWLDQAGGGGSLLPPGKIVRAERARKRPSARGKAPKAD
jgi:hypothetical protein